LIVEFARTVLEVAAVLLALAGLVVSLRNLRDAVVANRDLARAVTATGPDAAVRLRGLLDAGDAAAAVALLKDHTGSLPPREQAFALDSLTQRSAAGRQVYARMIAASIGNA
jgi:hypothetical protein